jgi:alpha-beta hydrolase superfamily lysophospholipase
VGSRWIPACWGSGRCGSWATSEISRRRSAGPRAAPAQWSHYTDDLDLFLKAIERRSPGRKLFLFGHSMGGAIATLVALDHQPHLAGLILSAPALAIDAPPMFLALTQLLGATLPRARVLDLANRDFSSDPAVSRSMDVDPLISQGPGPARTAIGSVVKGIDDQIRKHLTQAHFVPATRQISFGMQRDGSFRSREPIFGDNFFSECRKI